MCTRNNQTLVNVKISALTVPRILPAALMFIKTLAKPAGLMNDPEIRVKFCVDTRAAEMGAMQ
jgi:hypothetical protein